MCVYDHRSLIFGISIYYKTVFSQFLFCQKGEGGGAWGMFGLLSTRTHTFE
jgi:hypothetical protein